MFVIRLGGGVRFDDDLWNDNWNEEEIDLLMLDMDNWLLKVINDLGILWTWNC